MKGLKKRFASNLIIYIITLGLFQCEPLPLYVYYGEVSLSWQDAAAFCVFSYGTQLASIHNIAEQNEAGVMCSSAATSNECWVGTSDMNTDIDYNEYCPFVVNNNDIHMCNDDCHTERHLLCNYPTFLATIDTKPFNYLCDYHHQFTHIKGGDWSIDKSHCWLTQNTENGDAHIAWLGDKDPTSIKWRDYIIEFAVNILSGDMRAEAGVLFRAQSVSTYYYLCIQANTGIRLSRMEHERLSHLHVAYPIHIELNQDYTIRIEVISDRFTVYCDNKQLFTYSNTMYRYGSIGLRTFAAVARFKSLRIIFPHHTSPSIITNNMRHLLATKSRPVQCGDRVSGNYEGEPISFTHHATVTMNVMFDTRRSALAVTEIFVYGNKMKYLKEDEDHNGVVLLTDAVPGDYTFVLYGASNDTFIVQLNCFLSEAAPTAAPSARPTANVYSLPSIFNQTVHIRDTYRHNALVAEIGSTMLLLLTCAILCLGTSCLCAICLKVIRRKKKRQFIRTATMMRLEQQQHAPESHQTYSFLKARAQRIAQVDDWLTNEALLPELVPNFINNGYESLDIIKEIEKISELQVIGVTKRSHQMIILSRIKKLNKPKNEPNPHDQVVIKVHSKPNVKNARRKQGKIHYKYQNVSVHKHQSHAERKLKRNNNENAEDVDDFWTYGAPDASLQEEAGDISLLRR